MTQPTSYSPLFQCHSKLRELVESKWDNLVLSDARHAVTGFVFGKAHKTHQAILLLCDKGYGQDAAILVRSLFELEVTLFYILADNTDKRARRYLDYDFVNRLRRYEYAQTQEDLMKQFAGKEPEEGWEQLKEYAAKAQEEFSYSGRGWSDKSIKAMAKDVGLQRFYETIYRMLCDLAHSDPRTIHAYAAKDIEVFSMETGQSDSWLQESLVGGFDFYFHIVKAWQETFFLNIKEQLSELESEWITALAQDENKQPTKD